MQILKLTQITNAAGVFLSNGALFRQRLEQSRTVAPSEATEGVALTPCDPALEEQLQAGRAFMKEFRYTFHQFAK